MNSIRHVQRRGWRLGFVPLVDAAALIVAKERGFFASHGIDAVLERQIGWATLRDKIIHGELDGAHAPATMLWSMSLGSGCSPTEVLTGFVLTIHGNAITLSQRLWKEGVRNGNSLRANARKRRASERLTFAVPFRYSAHYAELMRWLTLFEVDPSHVRVLVVPPRQMLERLATGWLDGYCVGEPWNSLAVQQGIGWCPAWSAAVTPGEPGKVFLVTRAFAETFDREHRSIIAALAQASEWCQNPENRESLAELLARDQYLHCPVAAVLPSLSGRFDCGNQRAETVPNFLVFHGNDVNAPTLPRALMVQSAIRSLELVQPGSRLDLLSSAVFRHDIYLAALSQHPRAVSLGSAG